jgi:hypothetical protein
MPFGGQVAPLKMERAYEPRRARKRKAVRAMRERLSGELFGLALWTTVRLREGAATVRRLNRNPNKIRLPVQRSGRSHLTVIKTHIFDHLLSSVKRDNKIDTWQRQSIFQRRVIHIRSSRWERRHPACRGLRGINKASAWVRHNGRIDRSKESKAQRDPSPSPLLVASLQTSLD